jgi:hypothetical protein
VPLSPIDQLERHRVARRLRDSACHRIGLASCGEGVDVAAAARELASALGEVCDGPIAIVMNGDRVAPLIQSLAADAEGYAHVLVPLTALRGRGEQLAGYDLVDGVVVLVRQGRVSEAALLEQKRELGATPLIGVVVLP